MHHLRIVKDWFLPVFTITIFTAGLAWLVISYARAPAIDQPAPNDVPPPETAVVARVIDAATIELASGQRVRYVGVVMPGVGREVHCFGKEAFAANEQIIGKSLRLEGEPLANRAADGVWLRYAWLREEQPTTPVQSPSTSPSSTPDQPEEILINERIIEGGFGFPLLTKEMKYHDRMSAAARYASATRKGLWGRCSVSEAGPGVLQTQVLEDCIIKGSRLPSGQQIYRTPACAAYGNTTVLQSEGGEWLCDEVSAQGEGWQPANDCPAHPSPS